MVEVELGPRGFLARLGYVTIVLFFHLLSHSSIDSLLLTDFLLTVPLERPTPKHGFLHYVPRMVLFFPLSLWTSSYFMRD